MSRLIGQETEYAIRFSPEEGGLHPGNTVLFQALRSGIRRQVRVRESTSRLFQEKFFIENGGSFYYEHQPFAPDGGLIECGTPECLSPGEILLYQRAQEELLRRALPTARDYLRNRGHAGQLGLIKNCRDAAGHIYGAQENYEAPIATGLRLWLYRCILPPVLIPAVCMYLVFRVYMLALIVLVLSAMLLFYFVYAALRLPLTLIEFVLPNNRFKKLGRTLMGFRRRIELHLEKIAVSGWVARLEYAILLPVWNLFFFPFTMLVRTLAFHKQRRNLHAFFITRPIISGAGTLIQNPKNGSEHFYLSEKATATRRMIRWHLGASDRTIFDSGNMYKSMLSAVGDLFTLRSTELKRQFRIHQRLQIGLSDSNRLDFAEYLKVGITCLLLEMCDADCLDDAPRILRPIRSLRRINADAALKEKVPVILYAEDGKRKRDRLSALEIQRWYCGRAQRFVATEATVDLELREIARLWSETLDLLERDPGLLIGRLDWVSKRYLIEAAGEGTDFAVRKKIDLAYHELEGGYADMLLREKIAPHLVHADEVEQAIKKPSSSQRARLRSRYIRSIPFEGERISVSWNAVRTGRWPATKVIDLDEYRSGRPDDA
ncbi:MAG: proteasome accessory factor PafA2 family protein [Leptospiraceae bacterium]|nr:proteasome accessory factor PafA2 family protein [Leptospiraceae bacterium]